MEPNINPTITCLCVTDSSLEELTKSIYNFEQQSYKSKELTIVYNHYRDDIKKLSASYPKSNVKFFTVKDYEKHSIADLNEIALSKVESEYFCMWNASDWHNPKRLSAQLNGISTFYKTCSFLFQHLICIKQNRELYVSPRRPLEKSLMCNVDFFRNNCRFHEGAQENTELVESLIANNCIAPISEPTLYISNDITINEYGEFLPSMLLEHSQKMDDLSYLDVFHIISHLPELSEVEAIFKRQIEKSIGLITGLPRNVSSLSRSV